MGHRPGNSHAEKNQGFLVNILLQWLFACLQLPHQGSAPGHRCTRPPVLSPSETNFWLRPWIRLRPDLKYSNPVQSYIELSLTTR